MTSYFSFYKFYDQVMADRSRPANFIQSLIHKYHPTAESLLELACGTGSILDILRKKYSVSGLDLSPEMLSVAKRKLPCIPLYHLSMTEFSLNQKFDAIICVFDSINHLLRFQDWKRVFARAASHLEDGGIFIFDVNTERKLQRHISEPPWILEFDGNTMIMDVRDGGRGIADWNIRVFERKDKTQYVLHEETIREIAFPRKRIELALRKRFSSVVCIDSMGAKPSRKSENLYFVCGL